MREVSHYIKKEKSMSTSDENWDLSEEWCGTNNLFLSDFSVKYRMCEYMCCLWLASLLHGYLYAAILVLYGYMACYCIVGNFVVVFLI